MHCSLELHAIYDQTQFNLLYRIYFLVFSKNSLEPMEEEDDNDCPTGSSEVTTSSILINPPENNQTDQCNETESDTKSMEPISPQVNKQKLPYTTSTHHDQKSDRKSLCCNLI